MNKKQIFSIEKLIYSDNEILIILTRFSKKNFIPMNYTGIKA